MLLGHRSRGLDAASAAEVSGLPTTLRRADAAAVLRDPAGCGRWAEAALGTVGYGAWLHLDVDVLDPDWLPAAG